MCPRLSSVWVQACSGLGHLRPGCASSIGESGGEGLAFFLVG